MLDGDSLVLATGEQVRLIGINAPEFGRDGRPDEPLAQEARAALRALVQGKEVTFFRGREAYDRYGRLLAHAWLPDGTNVEERLLRLGLAVVVAVPPNVDRLAAYQAAERTARAAGLGVWGHAYYAPTAAERLRPGNTGFRFVTGRVRRVWDSEENIHVVLAPHFSVLVPRADLGYFPQHPRALRGRRVVVRGWISGFGETLHVRVRHPAMMNVID